MWQINIYDHGVQLQRGFAACTRAHGSHEIQMHRVQIHTQRANAARCAARASRTYRLAVLPWRKRARCHYGYGIDGRSQSLEQEWLAGR